MNEIQNSVSISQEDIIEKADFGGHNINGLGICIVKVVRLNEGIKRNEILGENIYWIKVVVEEEKGLKNSSKRVNF